MKQMTYDFDILFEQDDEAKDQIQNRVFRAAISYIEHYMKIYGREKAVELVKNSTENIDLVL